MTKRFFLQLFIVAGLLLPVFSGVATAQFSPLPTCFEEDGTTIKAKFRDSPACNEAAAAEEPLVGDDGILTTATNILALVAGVIAVIMIVVAGIQMTLSGGDGQKVSNSRNSIIYAAVGIAVIVFARAIVIFVINRVG